MSFATSNALRRSAHKTLRFCVLLAASAALCVAASAETAAASGPNQGPSTRTGGIATVGPAWSSLTVAQQKVLSPLKADWVTIDSARKSKWLEIAARFHSLPLDEQQRVQERMGEWARMSPRDRATARMQFQGSRQLSADDRQASWAAYQALPDGKKRELAKQAEPPSAAKPSSVQTTSRLGANTGLSAASVTQAKRNLVAASSSLGYARAVTPTVVQSKPGATTTLMSNPPLPPLHQQPGLPKIAATDGFVDAATLLPKKGPQSIIARAASASETTVQP